MNRIRLGQSETIYLRPIQLSDVTQRYYDWLADPEVNQFLETRYEEQTLENIEEFVRNKLNNADEPLFAICDAANNSHIGNIKLGPINWRHRRADISLFIGDKNYWGKGIATKAIRLLTCYAMDELELNKLQAGAYHKNVGSINAFKKNGFHQEGYVKELCQTEQGNVDMVLLGLTKQQYLSHSTDLAKGTS